MICKSCGASLRTGEEVCRECGKRAEMMDGNGFWDLLGSTAGQNLTPVRREESERVKTVSPVTAIGRKYLPLLACVVLCLATLLIGHAIQKREVRNLRTEYEAQLLQQAEFFREERTALEEECEKLREENRILREQAEAGDEAFPDETSDGAVMIPETAPEAEPEKGPEAEPEAEAAPEPVPGELEI